MSEQEAAFTRQADGQLAVDGLPLKTLAERYGTPLYIYSDAALTRNWQAFARHWPAPHRLCYAVKANSNLAILQRLAQLGAGFDIVSGGELARVLAAGGDAAQVVFSGVAKSVTEITQALTAGIGCFNVESLAELDRINAIAADLGCIAPVSLRINPDVDAQTHPYIATGLKANKFGIAMDDAVASFVYAASLAHVKVVGADCHIGSQILSVDPFLDAAQRMLDLVAELARRDIPLQHLDMGGGMGIQYQQEAPFALAEYLQRLQALVKEQQPHLTLMLEPGRALVGNSGVLVTQVEYLKRSADKCFALVDAGMNDLVRPALYQAWHDIVPVHASTEPQATLVDVVGPVCETGDFLGHARHLAVKAGDYLAVMNAGAYGFTMASNYNTRPRAAELLVRAGQAHVIREREELQQLWKDERLLP
ncbi:diaminopimelate decarboxylase [Idiomarina xiamenensis]|uniref:Diaminopimelate decarboxylase n=1 Tax=Idiomarina xiamenensis 10-D-4 TaxID=740709 RepID=K2JYY3_9GAMM|nr:diaminopimelate decarboxylase [Idiomarina xiamenensis]EKE80603.1 diaminopimelate decarboxylase [Idiomarina xiamenensis 10-D-4]